MTWFQKPPLGTPLDWSNPLNKDLKLHIAMNEGHGDKVQDLSLNGNHGTLNGFSFPPTVASGWNPGQTGVGLNFDGIDDYVNCGNAASLNITGARTLSFWLNFGVRDAQQVIIQSGTDERFSIQTGSEGSGRFLIRGVTGSDYFCGGSCPTGEVTLFSIVLDDGYIDPKGFHGKVYKNGNIHENRRGNIGYNSLPVTFNGTDTRIGGVPYYLLNGSIDQVRVNNRAWTAKEVLDYAINPWQVYLDEDD